MRGLQMIELHPAERIEEICYCFLTRDIAKRDIVIAISPIQRGRGLAFSVYQDCLRHA